MGNWLSFTNDGSTQTRSFNNQNQLTAISGAYTPTYDNNGNTTMDEAGVLYTYDAWNRLVKPGGSSIVYSYDALGRRITRLTGGGFTPNDFYYTSSGQVVEQDQGSVPFLQNQYVWSMAYVDAPIEEDQGYNGPRLYAMEDANWNVVGLVDSSGTYQGYVLYDPYGKPSGTFGGWDYYFQGGRYFSINSSLLNFRNRDYSPTLGRWMEQDPIGYGGGNIDLYGYERDEPADSLDPSGLADQSVAGGTLTVTATDTGLMITYTGRRPVAQGDFLVQQWMQLEVYGTYRCPSRDAKGKPCFNQVTELSGSAKVF